MTRLLAAIFLLLAGAQGAFAAAPITFGSSVVLLTGPWHFRTGDNPDWKAAAFDDTQWETVDLTPRAGAHDSDVGLTNYVPGWAARGHAGYKGFAWYRSEVHVSVSPGQSLALVGPADVDSAYQIFLNGHLIGSDGDFSRATPVPVSIQPHLFALPPAYGTISNGVWIGTIAIRVWCRSAPPPDGGGIHVAPFLGLANAAQGQYRLQWMQTFEGYILDATEGVVFLLLAVMAASLIPFERAESFLPWLIGGLVLIAALRLNQAIMFWGQWETISDYLIFRYVFAEPLALAAWTMTWRAALGQGGERWSRIAILALTLLCIAGQTLSLSMLSAMFHAALQSCRPMRSRPRASVSRFF